MEVYKSTRTAAELNYALGAVPSIGENGNWWIGDQDTGVLASGLQVSGAKVGQAIKVSEVDSNGVPVAWEATDAIGNLELVASYVHEGNKVVQPDSVDIATGVWTVNAGHGLSTGDIICMFTNSTMQAVNGNTYKQIPVVFGKNYQYGLTASVIDANTFTLLDKSGAAIDLSTATEVNCSLFRFESRPWNRTLCEFNDLSSYDEIIIRMRGQTAAMTTSAVFRGSGFSDFFGIFEMNDKSNAPYNYTGQLIPVDDASSFQFSDVGGIKTGDINSAYMVSIQKINGRYYVESESYSRSVSINTNTTQHNGAISSVKGHCEVFGQIDTFVVDMYYKSFVANGFTVEVYAK